MIQNNRYLKTAHPTLKTCLIDSVAHQENQLIQQAIQCLEKRIKYRSDLLANPHEVSHFLRLQLAQELNEVFAVLFLSNQHHVLAFEKLFFGTINSTTVHPRVIIQRALTHNAAAVIIAHNHPSGNLEPSSADQYITQQLKALLNQIDVRLLDHFIVSLEGTLSFVERGLL